MAFRYIRFYQSYQDPVWGAECLWWIRSPLIRVFRNRLRKSIFEWVGSNTELTQRERDYYRQRYPVVMQASWLDSKIRN